MSQTLRELLEENELLDHVEELERDGFTPKTLAMLTDGDVDDIVKAWPRGARIRFHALCRSLRPAPIGLPEHPPHPDIIASLPTPLARAAGNLIEARTALDALDAADTALDRLLRTVALVCEADYLHAAGWHDPELNGMFQKLERPSLGTWRSFIELAIRGAAASRHAIFLRELPDTWARTEGKSPIPYQGVVYDEFGQPVAIRNSLGLLEWLVARRNAYAHAKIPNKRDPGPAREYRDRACEAIREYGWLSQYELWMGLSRGALLLRGPNPAEAPGAPVDVQSPRDICLRRIAFSARGGAQTLAMPPLIVAATTVAGGPTNAERLDREVLLYNTFAGKNRIHYTGDSVAFETANTNLDLRRRQDRKEFERIGRAELTPEKLLARIRAATARTLRILEATDKYRAELHVERREYEPRLEGWIDSPVPLLGVAAEAGSGKTGILANLTRTWITGGDRPVLLLLARDFQTQGTLDLAIREALHLREASTSDIARCLKTLAIVVDGLNEHPQRESLLDGICREAQDTQDRSSGARFVLSWRTEDAAWMQPALEQANLWWTPPKATLAVFEGFGDLERDAPGDLDSDWDEAPASNKQDAGPGGNRSMPGHGRRRLAGIGVTSRRASDEIESPSTRFITLSGFTESEVEEAWNRYREKAPHKMRPRFEWAELAEANPELSWDLRNPLRMRIALECYHNQPLPESVRAEQLFDLHLDGLRYGNAPVAKLLALLGQMLHEFRATRFTVRDLEQQADGYELVWSKSGVSAFDILVGRGVLSILKDSQGRSFTFTVERVAEQVLGEHLLTLSASETAEDLAGLAADLVPSGFMLAPGAIRTALDARLYERDEIEGLNFLKAFLDAAPPQVDSLAGPAVRRLAIRAGEDSAGSVAAALLAEPSESNFLFAAEAARSLLRRGQAAFARRFLAPFLAPAALDLMSSSVAAAKLGVECLKALVEVKRGEFEGGLAGVLDRERAVIDAVLDRLRRFATGGPEADRCEPLCEALDTIGLAFVGAGTDEYQRHRGRSLLEEAVGVRRIRFAEVADEPARRSLAEALSSLGVALQRQRDLSEAVAAHEEQLRLGTTPEHLSGWDERLPLRQLASCYEKLNRFKEALRIRFKIADLTQRREERAEYAKSLEAIGQTFFRAGRHDDAISAFEQAYRAATFPSRLSTWASRRCRLGIARSLAAKGKRDAAREELRRSAEEDFAAGLRDSAARTLADLGHAFTVSGDFVAGLECYLSAIEAASRSANVDLVADIGVRCGQRLADEGRLSDACEVLTKAVAFAKHPRTKAFDLWGLKITLSECLIALARPEDALQPLEHAIGLGRTHPRPRTRRAMDMILWPLNKQARCYLAMSLPDAAILCLEAEEALADRLEAASAGYWYYLFTCAVYWETRRDAASQLGREPDAARFSWWARDIRTRMTEC